MPSPDDPTPRASRPTKRLLALVAGGLLVLGAGLLLAARLVVDAGFAEARLRGAFPGHRVSVASADLGLLGRSFILADVRLEPAAPGGTRVAVDTLSVEGIRWLPLLLHGRYAADEVRLAGPVVRLTPGPGGRPDSVGPPPDSVGASTHADSAGAAPRLVRLAAGAPEIRVGRLEVRRGSLRVDPTPGSPGGRAVWHGLRLDATDVRVDSAAAADTSRVLFSRGLEASVDSLRQVSTDSLSSVSTGAARVSTRDTALVIHDFRSGPTLPPARFWGRLEHRSDYDVFRIRRLAAPGLDLGRWAARGDLVAPLVRLEGLDVDVTSNKRLPSDPDPPDPRFPRRFLELGRAVAFDTVRATGRARYAEIAEGTDEPGVVRFEDLALTGYGVTNDTARLRDRPVVVDARVRPFGAAVLTTRFRFPLLGDGLRVEYRGGVGRMSVTHFNSLLVPLEGVRFESGVIDTLSWDVRVEGDTATGTLAGTYRELEVRMVDRGGGAAGPVDLARTFLLDLAVEESREADEEHTVRIGRAIPRDVGLFGALWFPVRSGLRSLMGL